VKVDLAFEGGIVSQFLLPLLDKQIDEVQFARLGDPQDLPGEIAVKRADFGDRAAMRQMFEKNGPGRQDNAFPKVMDTKLGSRLYQTAAPKSLVCNLLLAGRVFGVPKAPRIPRGASHETTELEAK
jgi:hypothetical protein